MNEEFLKKEIELLQLQMKHARELIDQALPYVIFHYERSGVGFGKAARNLMNKMKEFLGIK